MNDIEINTWLDVYHQFKKAQDGKTIVSVTVNRDENGENKEYSFDVKPYSKKLFERTQNVNYVDMQIGISPVTTHNVFKVVGTSFKEMGLSIYKLFNTLGMLLFSSEVHISDLTGVVGIFRLTSQAASSGFSNTSIRWW